MFGQFRARFFQPLEGHFFHQTVLETFEAFPSWHWSEVDTCGYYMGVEPKIGGFPPKSSHFNRIFHYKPSILGENPLFLETPIFTFITYLHIEKSYENHLCFSCILVLDIMQE